GRHRPPHQRAAPRVLRVRGEPRRPQPRADQDAARRARAQGRLVPSADGTGARRPRRACPQSARGARLMAPPVHLTFLGGLGEIGRNCAVLEIEDSLLLIDCGLMFPNEGMLGVDLVLPDFTWLIERADDIAGCVVTHGHEDHVGALSYLLREVSFPLFGTELSLGLARGRIEEAGLLGRTDFHTVADGERWEIGPFDVEFIPAAHSVPQGVATAFRTPQGTI